MPFSCINAKGNDSSLDVSHASMETASKLQLTCARESRMGDSGEQQRGCGSRWRALAWIIDTCMDGGRKGRREKRMSANNNGCSINNGCKCSCSSGIGFKPSMLAERREKIDGRQRRQWVDGRRAINGQDDRPGHNCTSATGAENLWDEEEAGESWREMRSFEHRHLSRKQTTLDYDDKMLRDIIRINMIQNNVYLPTNRSISHSDAFGRHAQCGLRSRRPINGGGGGGGGGRGSAGDGEGGREDGEERRWWRLEGTVEEKEMEDTHTTNEHHRENIHCSQLTADDKASNGANDIGSSNARYLRSLSCTSPGPNEDARRPSIRLRIVHVSNDTHSFSRQTTAFLPRRRNDLIPTAHQANYLQDGGPEAVMSSCHYWHRHRHRERNQRRAMDRVAEWIMGEEENASLDVARNTKIVSHHSDRKHHHHHHHRSHHNNRKYTHHHRQNWHHIIV